MMKFGTLTYGNLEAANILSFKNSR